MRREEWLRVQTGEFRYHEKKAPGPFREHKIAYWKALIASLPDEVQSGLAGRVIDVGCGGASILLAVNARSRVGLDPLMDRYIQQFPYLRDETDIEWLTSAAEETEFEERFDVVFALNSFDHVYDPAAAANHIAEWVKPGGHLVLTMNTHNTRFFRAYYSKLYRLIDHHHPHQFDAGDVRALFPDLKLCEERDIDALWLEFAEDYYRNVLSRPFEDRRKWLRGAVNPFKWPIGFSKFVLGRPPHRKRPDQPSIYSERLFVFRREL